MSRSVRRQAFRQIFRLHFLAGQFFVAATLLGACSGATAGPGAVDAGGPESSPVVSPDQPYGPYPTLPVTGAEPPVGNTGRDFPELSVSLGDGYLVELVDPEARAWWVVISGTGANEGDRIEIVAEVGDVWPGAAVRVYVGDELFDTTDLSGLIGNRTAVAGGCHPTLDLCFSSAAVDIRPDGGRLSVALDGTASQLLEIRGATAGWDGEPYTLGQWRGTEAITTR